MKFKTIALAASVFAFSTISVAATTVTVGGSNYDVTITDEVTYNDNQALLESQIWFGNEGLAAEFAMAVGDEFGLPNGANNSGPVFAFADEAIVVNLTSTHFEGIVNFFGNNRFENYVDSKASLTIFAIAEEIIVTPPTGPTTPPSAVPLPAGGVLLLSGLACVAGLKRRKKRSV